MAVNDPIGDMIARIRNAAMRKRGKVLTPASKLRQRVLDVLKDEGYIANFAEETDKEGHRQLVVTLKYVDGAPAITGIQRHSKPGRRLYYGYTEIPRVLGGLGVAILTTSKGLLKDAEARRQKIGGELLCKIW